MKIEKMPEYRRGAGFPLRHEARGRTGGEKQTGRARRRRRKPSERKKKLKCSGRETLRT